MDKARIKLLEDLRFKVKHLHQELKNADLVEEKEKTLEIYDMLEANIRQMRRAQIEAELQAERQGALFE